MQAFATPQQTLQMVDSDALAALITAAADVAVVIDGKGVVRDVALGSDDLGLDNTSEWIGRSWADTVTVESRPKVAALLREGGGDKPRRRWRHINHPSSNGADVPVMYSAVPVGAEGSIVALGRDMRTASALQQRLVEAQQAMERDYAQLRHMETRYRLLFRAVSDAVLIVDAATQRISELNPAAERLLGESARRLTGQPLLERFDPASRDVVEDLLRTVRTSGRVEDSAVQLVGDPPDVTLSASLFRQENGTHFLVRLQPARGARASLAEPAAPTPDLAQVMDRMPDAFVVTDPEGRILSCNAAFVEMAQLALGDQAAGEPLERWLGSSGVEMNVLLGNLRQRGSVRLFSTLLRGQYGSTTPIEVSAAAVSDAEHPCIGFTIRDVGRRLAPAAGPAGKELPRTASQLTGLVGRVPLKEIVSETTELIEQLCIEAALELTDDNRASAAEMLGLSRQSLYVKLRRFGMADGGADPA